MTTRVETPRDRKAARMKTAAILMEAEERAKEQRVREAEEFFLRIAQENNRAYLEREKARLLREQMSATAPPKKAVPKMAKKQAAAIRKRELREKFFEGLTTGAATAVILLWALIRAGVIG